MDGERGITYNREGFIMPDPDRLLELCEALIDENREEATLRKFRDSLNYRRGVKPPLRIKTPCEFESIPVPQTHTDMEAMLYNELIGCVEILKSKSDALPMIRANYGVGTFPSLFGMESVFSDSGMPWVKHAGSADAVRRIVEKGMPDVKTSGYAPRITETHQYYREMLKPYPKCSRYLRIYHPDLQGPFDDAHLIWGSDIYMALYDEEDLIHSLMQVITDTYLAYMDQLLTETNGETDGFNYHWGSLFKGRIVVRDDSSVNLSRSMYREFVMPYMEQIADYYNGVALHFCGRADQWVDDLLRIKNINSVNFGYIPGKFDNAFLRMIKNTAAETRTGIVSYEMNPEEYPMFDPEIFKTGITYTYAAPDMEDGKRIWDSWQK